jgi:hypothetical protein
MKVLLYIAVVILLQPIANAQWNMNPKINMKVVAHNQKFNRLAGFNIKNYPFQRLRSGQFLIHWGVGGSSGSTPRVYLAASVYAQLINPDGRKAWPGWGVALVDSSFSNADHSFSVLASTEDRILVFYHRNTYRSDTNRRYSQLYVQKFNIHGQALFPGGGKLISSGVYQYTNGTRGDPISVQTAENAFTVVYQEYAYMQGASHYRMRMQRIDSSGQAQHGPEGIAVTPWLREWGGSGIEAKALYADGHGGAHLFYTAFDNYRSHVFMQRVDSNGMTRWPDQGLKINTNAKNTLWTQITATTDGSYAIVTNQQDTTGTSVPWKFYGHKIDTAGNRMWDADGVSLFPTRNQSDVAYYNIAPDGGGGIFWAGKRTDSVINQDTSYVSLRVQRIDETGRLCLGPEGIAIESGASKSMIPSPPIPIPDGLGGAIITYGYRVPGGRYGLDEDIKGQRIDSTGRKLWGDNGVYISSADSCQQNPKVIADGQGGIVVIWEDFRNVSTTGHPPVSLSEIYATRIRSNGGAYPVELASFTAQLEGERVRLDWHTESETNNAGFEIERAIPQPIGRDARESLQWERIGYVPGNGSTNVNHAYIYHDALTPELLGQSELLYRLRQIDYDGTHEYSSIARVLVNPPTKVFLDAVYPNPANLSAVLRFALPSEQLIRLAVYDVLGREVLLIHEGSLPTGVYEYEAHLDQLPAGLYHVLLITPLGRQARRMVVAR